MVYSNFGKVKTITLPFTGTEDGLTLDQYKERFGIDLLDIIELKDDFIQFKESRYSNNLILLNHEYHGIYPAITRIKGYNSGTSSAYLNMVYLTFDDEDAVTIENGFYLTISQDAEFKAENIRIYGHNV